MNENINHMPEPHIRPAAKNRHKDSWKMAQWLDTLNSNDARDLYLEIYHFYW